MQRLTMINVSSSCSKSYLLCVSQYLCGGGEGRRCGGEKGVGEIHTVMIC